MNGTIIAPDQTEAIVDQLLADLFQRQSEARIHEAWRAGKIGDEKAVELLALIGAGP